MGIKINDSVLVNIVFFREDKHQRDREREMEG